MIYILGWNFPKCVYKTLVFFIITPKKRPSLVKKTWGITLCYIPLLEIKIYLQRKNFRMYLATETFGLCSIYFNHYSHGLEHLACYAVLHSDGAQQLPEKSDW